MSSTSKNKKFRKRTRPSRDAKAPMTKTFVTLLRCKRSSLDWLQRMGTSSARLTKSSSTTNGERLTLIGLEERLKEFYF